jgi:uncharacterized alkaline shock family protein YloU
MTAPEPTEADIIIEAATTVPASKAAPRTAGGPIDRRPPGARLITDRGVTQISDVVVSKIAALATREIPGVHAMGKGLARAFGALRSRVPGSPNVDTTTQGIVVEVGERQAAIDIDIVAYYGLSIIETTEAVRANVIDRLETMTGLEVVEVNINVDDLYFDADSDLDDGPSRVL